MPDWEEDGERLQSNVLRALERAGQHARERRRVTLDDLRAWHRTVMEGLDIPEALELGIDPARLVGEFRGPPNLPGVENGVGAHAGTPSARVALECEAFIRRLQAMLAALDELWPIERLDELTEEGLVAIARAAAWAHGEWIRIHPFANGNGRTARLLANAILERYGLRPVVRTRPRPEGSYVIAATLGTLGDYSPMERYIVAQLVSGPRGP
jgi:Fic family protein